MLDLIVPGWPITRRPTANEAQGGAGALAGVASLVFSPSATLAALWTPAQLSSTDLKAWFDFSDTATITQSGGAVSQVDDKSGNGNHVSQSTAGSKPGTGEQTLNGLNVLTFDGGDVLSRSSGLSLPGWDPGATMIALRLYTSGTGGGLAWVAADSGSFGDLLVLGRDAGVMGAWGDRTINSTTTAASYSDSDNTNWHLSSGVYEDAARSIYEDGDLKNTNGNAISNNAAVTSFHVGQCLSRDRATNRFITGRIAQVIVLAGVGATNRQKVEGWAMWKYGLQSQLPAGHPYKSAAPVV